MSEPQAPRYRIVFKGELAYDYQLTEVRENLRRLCGFNDSALERLFSGEAAILKNNLPLAVARKYKAALDETGAVCLLEEIPQTPPPPPATEEAPRCPKCAAPRHDGDSCQLCGIVYAKFEQLQARQQQADNSPPPGWQTPGPGDNHTSDAENGFIDRLFNYFAGHQEQAFLVKSLLIIALIMIIKPFFDGFIGLILILIAPFALWLYIRYTAHTSNRSFFSVLREHITFMPMMYTEGEKKTKGVAGVTYSIIAINILIFYLFQLQVDTTFIDNNLLFLPIEPTVFNVPIGLFTSIFLHGSHGHLWGNMMFLWAVGTVVEKRIGAKKFSLYYLLSGVMANLVFALITYLAEHRAGHALGASGAISGVMGIFAVRCYFKSMVFPLPILGIFSLILPVSLKVRLNSLVLIGLFFAMDLSDGIAQVTGDRSSNIAHWAHIGGMLCGVALAMLSKLGDEAIGERHLEIGRQAMSKGGDLYAGEESMRLALQRDPENPELMLMLGKLLSKFEPNAEGEELYRKGMARQVVSNPKEAMQAYCDYYDRYMQATDPQTQMRLAALFERANDLLWAARCLELLSDSDATPEAIRERAIFHCARIKESMGQDDVARHYYRLFLETFPQSPMVAKVQARLDLC